MFEKDLESKLQEMYFRLSFINIDYELSRMYCVSLLSHLRKKVITIKDDFN